jgi:LysM repeat protein
MNMDGGSSFGSYVVTGLAIVGIALGGSALYVGLNGRSGDTKQDDQISELGQKVERLTGATDELQGQIRGLYNQTRTALDGLATQVTTLRDEVKPKASSTPATASAASTTSSTTAPTAASGKTYTVRAGDYPAKIAKTNNITVDALMKANPGLKPEKLKVGQVVHLP